MDTPVLRKTKDERRKTVDLRRRWAPLRSEVGGPACFNPYMAKNVLGGDLYDCSVDPVTGWFRDGACNTGPGDHGMHIVCAVMTEQFLEFSKRVGNDLSTPQPQHRFAGLKPGDRWCLGAARWAEALRAGVAPPVVLEATNAHVLEWVGIEELEARRHA